MSTPNPHPALKAVTLTHVRYQKGDQLGHFLAWISLVPIFISLGGFFSHFIFRRELQGMFFAIGLLISQFVNEIIKKSVQQARPEMCVLLEMCDSHGWPSSHSQYMLFFAVYLTLLTHYRIGALFRYQMWIVRLLVWPLAVLTMYSRAIEESAFGRFFYVKDTSHLPNVLKFDCYAAPQLHLLCATPVTLNLSAAPQLHLLCATPVTLSLSAV
ncbi:hypothetical protein DH2020_040076 [Rehmannia glutinosa]|uniref:Phosphatidic acid phosphatase type 2/haloperoxidase domain-containing protein n=1 Tax=Rehmannia glutinosa TaxID=99300 RepID=A0ABR0UW80_REHGL